LSLYLSLSPFLPSLSLPLFISPSPCAGTPPCTDEQYVINVTSEADFAQRLRYSPTQTVYLALQNRLLSTPASSSMPAASCTIVNNTNPAVPLNLTYPG